MTRNREEARAARARSVRTGESYSSALRHVRSEAARVRPDGQVPIAGPLDSIPPGIVGVPGGPR